VVPFLRMKYLRCVIVLGAVLTVSIRAEIANGEATLIAIKGRPTLTAANGAAAPAKVGDKLTPGARVVSGAGSEATVRFFDGTVAVVQADSDVTLETLSVTTESGRVKKETTTVNLRKGGTVAILNPAKKAVTDYRVRTPRGVAVARGTVFAVRLAQNQLDATVTTMSGTVTFITDQGEVTVGFGRVTYGSGVMSVAQAVAANPSLAQQFVEAATSVAAAIGAGAIGSATQVNATLAALVDVAVQAVPNQAANIASNVLTAAAPGLGSNGAPAAIVIAQAAVRAANKVDGALGQNIGNEVAQAVATTAANLSIPITLAALQAAVRQESLIAGDTNPILAPLDQTQVIVSPVR